MKRLGGAEINQYDPFVPGQHDVGRLYVAVQKIAVMYHGEGATHCFRDRHNLIQRQCRVVRYPLLKGLPLQVLHHDVKCVVLGENIVSMHNVRRVQAVKVLCLLPKFLLVILKLRLVLNLDFGSPCTLGTVRQKLLDSYKLLVSGIKTLVDNAKSAFP